VGPFARYNHCKESHARRNGIKSAIVFLRYQRIELLSETLPDHYAMLDEKQQGQAYIEYKRLVPCQMQINYFK